MSGNLEMNIIVCIDDEYGMLFNHRRQSRDRLLRERILMLTKGKKLWMNAYSAKLFEEEHAENIVVDEDFFHNAGDGDYCFVETEDIMKYIQRIEGITLYRWNRRYPSDFKFTLDLSDWTMESTFEFVGSSHEKITEEIYRK